MPRMRGHSIQHFLNLHHTLVLLLELHFCIIFIQFLREFSISIMYILMSQIVDSTIAYIYKEIRLSCGLLYPIKILPYIFKSIARYVTAYFPIINERMCIGIKRDIILFKKKSKSAKSSTLLQFIIHLKQFYQRN